MTRVKDRILEAYSKLAVDYEKNVDTTSGVNAFYERPAMMNLMPADMVGLSVLDAGCAAGWYAEQFVDRGAEVTAIDMSPQMVDATKRRVGSKATVFIQDLTDPLKFRNEAFDTIISSLTLHYVEEWGPTFQEFYRVMKPGGYFVFSVNHPFMDFSLFKREDYFARELLQDVWNKKESGRVEVTYFRRTLAEIISVTATYFSVEQVVEPQPTNEFKERFPEQVEQYDYLMRNPHFLLIRSRKRV